MSARGTAFAKLGDRLTQRAALLARLRGEARLAQRRGTSSWHNARSLWPFFSGDER